MQNNIDTLRRSMPKRVHGRGGGGGKGGGGSGGSATEDANTLRSNAVARLIDIISEGTIRGLVNGGKSIFLDETALIDSASAYNFSGASYVERLGTPDQVSVPGFTTSENSVEVNVEVVHDTPVIRTYSYPIDAARVIISIPRLTSQDTDDGDLHGTSVTVQIHKRKYGESSWKLVKNLEISGKCTATYQTSVRVELGEDSDWDIQVTRITEDSDSSALYNETWWALTTTIIDGKFTYPNTAYIAWKIDASQFGSSVPKRAYDCYGLIVKIPDNYNPTTRTYTGIWGGTFTTAWTDNPAWILYDLLTAKDYGLGNYITEDMIDRWSLYEIAQWCDELVDDGFGGTEPRCTFNYWINSSANALEVLQSVASCFQGLIYWASGQIFFAADMPGDPVKLVTPANVRDGSFTYEGISASARHSVCAVTWFDPDDFCNQAVELVEDSTLVAEMGWLLTNATAYGCTSRGQAHRYGKWVLDSEYHATETVSYEAAFDHLDVVPGQIISLADPAYAGVRNGGRILSFTSDPSTITVDRAVTIEEGVEYTLQVVVSDGTIDSKTVLTFSAGEYDTLTLDSDFAVAPLVGAMWILTSSNLAPRQFRVISVSESETPYFAVTALLHDPTKYDRIESDIQLEEPIYTKLTGVKPSPVINLQVSERLYSYGTAIKTAATISWSASGDIAKIRHYEVQYKRENGNWTSVPITTIPSCDISDCDMGNYSFRVRAVGLTYLPSTWTQLDQTLFGLDAAPSNVTGLNIQVLEKSSTLSWTDISDIDVVFYIVKWTAALVDPSWSSALTLVSKCYNAAVTVPTMAGTYMVKAVDIRGHESANAATITPTATSVLGFNAVEAVSDWPTWGGTKTDVVVSGTTLKLDTYITYTGQTTIMTESAEEITTEDGVSITEETPTEINNFKPFGSYYFLTNCDLGTAYTSRISAQLDVGAENAAYLLQDWTSLSEVASLSGADSSNWKVSLVLRYTSDDPEDPGATWSSWSELLIGDYDARAYEFGILLYSYQSNVTPVINDITVTIDMPDRTIGAESVSISDAGTAILFDGAFADIPAVGITGKNLSSGDKLEYVSGPSASGFTILFRNSSGAAVARTIDWIAHGYGRVSS